MGVECATNKSVSRVVDILQIPCQAHHKTN